MRKNSSIPDVEIHQKGSVGFKAVEENSEDDYDMCEDFIEAPMALNRCKVASGGSKKSDDIDQIKKLPSDMIQRPYSNHPLTNEVLNSSINVPSFISFNKPPVTVEIIDEMEEKKQDEVKPMNIGHSFSTFMAFPQPGDDLKDTDNSVPVFTPPKLDFGLNI